MTSIFDFFLTTDIHLWISFVVAFIVMIYWTFAKVFHWKEIDTIAIIAIIGIPAVMSFSIDSIVKNHSTKGDVDFFIKQLEEFADCSYAKDKLADIRYDLIHFKNKSVETFNVDETICELIRAISKSKTEAVYIDHYILSWNKELVDLFQANLAAIERRVEIKRVFILSEDILSNHALRDQALKILQLHKNSGVDVRFISQKHLLGSDLNYKYYALNNYCLIDNELIVVSSPASQMQIMPIRSRIVWDTNKFKEINAFQNLLTSKYLIKFDSENDFIKISN